MNDKKVSDYVPILDDLGIDYVVASNKNGVGVQNLRVAMPADGIIVFADNGLSDMANDTYCALVQNQTDIADPATVVTAVDKITITGPDTGDILNIVIVGTLKGQVS